MKKRTLLVAATLLALGWCVSASALMGEHPAEVPVGQPPQWPEGMADLLNSPGRVYGWFFNSADFFCFDGDTQDFNEFIRQYAELQGVSHKLLLLPGRGETGMFDRNRIAFDWQVTMSFYLQEGKRVGGATVALWLDGQVELRGVKVPTNVQLEANADPQTHQEIADFVAAHEAKRKGEKITEAQEPPGAGDAQPETSGRFKSKRPLFGKVAVTADGLKVLSVALDESGGTRTGYDLLYSDVNFNGGFEESERAVAIAAKRYGSWLASSSFPPIALDVPYNKKAQGIPAPCQVTLAYSQYPRHGVSEELSVVVRFRLGGRPDEWAFAFSGGTIPSKALEKAPVWKAEGQPKLEMTVRPDGYAKGNIGVGLKLVAGEKNLECWKGGQPVKAHVEIKKPDGAVAHRGDATLDKFSFG